MVVDGAQPRRGTRPARAGEAGGPFAVACPILVRHGRCRASEAGQGAEPRHRCACWQIVCGD